MTEFEERKRAARTIPSVIDDEGEGDCEGDGEEGAGAEEELVSKK